MNIVAIMGPGDTFGELGFKVTYLSRDKKERQQLFARQNVN